MPDPSTLLTDLVEGTDSPIRVGFDLVCQHLYDRRFTGQVILHFRNGQPQEVEFPQPLKVKLTPGPRSSGT